MISGAISSRFCRATLGLVFCALLLAAAGVACSVMAQISVSATANIWGAGHAAPPGPGGGGAGDLPTLVPIPLGVNRTVVFSSVTGEIRYASNVAPNGPDGASWVGAPPCPVWGGVAGADMPTCIRYLTGVFLDDAEPSDHAPARIVFPDGAFAELLPGLCQIFYVGDGLTGTGTGTQQTFHIPDTATRLFLGFQDFYFEAPDFPGGYGDNTGAISLETVFYGEPVGIGGDGSSSSRSILQQNYPNPFNPSTTISFTLPERTRVDLSVFDIHGKLVATLVEETMDDGFQEVPWDGRDAQGNLVSSGVYFCRLTAGDKTLTKKMLLLK